MQTHTQIDSRSLEMAVKIAQKIDADQNRTGVTRAQQTLSGWLRRNPATPARIWLDILDQPWPAIRQALLDPSEIGSNLRQNSPFCGILTQQERNQIYREHRSHATT